VTFPTICAGAALATALTLSSPVVARAQDAPASPAAKTKEPDANVASPAGAQDEGDDAVLKPAEPDFTLIDLPTSLNLPKYKSAIRVTHRFRQEFGSNDFGANFFGIDSGAQIGLEFRFGILPHGQVGIQRTSERTIEFFTQYGLARQGKRMPLEIAALAAIDGTNNFRDSHTPAFGVIATRLIGAHAALYVEPIYVNNSNPLPKQLVDHNDTFMLGLGGRFRVLPSVYIVAEASPRLWGYKPGVNHGSLAIEKRVGGHLFQLNFSDSLATTYGQLATANHAAPGPASRNWYMGFNISRKFY
jgi:hypothetical protein